MATTPVAPPAATALPGVLLVVACDDAAPVASKVAASGEAGNSVASHGTGSTVGKTGGTPEDVDDDDETTGVWIIGVGGERFAGS